MKTKVTIAVGALLLVGLAGFGVWFLFIRPARIEFAKLGGTILLYEFLPEANQPADPNTKATIIRVLEQRLDPNDRGFVKVVAGEKNQVEIRVVKSDHHAEDLDVIKELIRRTGILEFRILANSFDDQEAIDLSIRQLNLDPTERTIAELKTAKENGLPPPGPYDPDTGEIKKFKILIGKDGTVESRVTYGWVELGAQERRQLNLDNFAPAEPQRSQAWHAMAANREQAMRVNEPLFKRPLLDGGLFYSRPCEDRNLTEEERGAKQFEYFVLAREPEWIKDPMKPGSLQQTPKVDGSYLSSAASGYDNALRPAIHFGLNAAGADLFGQLTGKNIPAVDGPEEHKRRLAIILDGLLVSAPTINSRITDRAQISGSFTQSEVNTMVTVLRAGALPARVKLVLVSERIELPTK